ncbi:MAG TPA: S8 family serine peptidase [Gaiellaceae bacterium]
MAAIVAALSLAPAAGTAIFVHPRVRVGSAPRLTGGTLVQLRTPGGALSPALRAVHARLVSAGLDVWRIRTGTRHTLAALRSEGLLAHAEPDQRFIPFHPLEASCPPPSSEWWIHDIGADQVKPPGPGVPLTVIDTGLDLKHPEFSNRPHTIALNPQVVVTNDDIHGTAVSSVAAASGGIRLVGVYPQVVLQEWDFGAGALSDILAGLDAASKRGRGVINFSGGFLGYSALLEQGIDQALARGAIVVAAVGNDRQNGSHAFVPATLPHVLTVGANDQSDHFADFSNRSSALDLVAPGVSIPVAVPTFYDPSGYCSFDGTSFSTPLVAGAAAWVWTQRPTLDPTQLEDVLRDSARPVGTAGWNADTGFGILSLPKALTQAPRPRDPQEPNDDINLVRPGFVTASGTHLSTPASLSATMDAVKDPEDVYRVWVPAHARITARTRSTHDVDLALWGAKARSVYERGRALRRDLLSFSQRPGSWPERVTARNKTGRGAYYFVDAFLGRRVSHASYALTVSVARR